MGIFSPEFWSFVVVNSAVVVSIVEVLKRLIGASGIFAVVITAVVSIGAGLMTGIGQFGDVFPVIVYIGCLFVVAQGWYKVVRSAPIK